ncbi:alpha/beta hydrolase [Streptomyces albireticuli]|uniref:Esterase n=1 Tax=Streptomyces albireticuli TaxID=1940 RepID=A0A2A2D3R6_9ACTN|nr:alpha/beta hydrolase-fold protein [Streptomyces albireticuli]MCD9143875.1 esterase family protein [Streptomyces albireticuli]MCD9161694.1 esterase family protein [Streptomyces albireticuli]MCD9191992.1 esterase family protein [Streptomyces albireticuli]PAU46097.1 esterase [Streptomyces albireticuli]
MGLTSRSLLYTVVFVAVLCVGLTVWLWPRLSGRGALPVLGRLGAILTTQLTIMSAVLLAVNSAQSFYGTWGQLIGKYDRSQGQVTGVTDLAGTGARVDTGKGGLVQPGPPEGLEKAGLPKGPPDQVGRMESVKIIGRRAQAAAPAFVYLPPQYFQKQYERQRFPVIVTITGYPGGTESLSQHLQVPKTASKLISENKMQPTVVVMLSPNIAMPRDTECVDVPGGPQAETFLTKDLPDALRSGYRVGHKASAWGALGYSSGGTCSLLLAMRQPDVYPVAAALSGDYKVGTDLTTGDLFGKGPDEKKRRHEHDLIWRLRNLPAPPATVLVTSSLHGEKNLKETKRFLDAVKPPMKADKMILPEGSHNFTTWRREISPAMEWMGKQLVFPQDVNN